MRIYKLRPRGLLGQAPSISLVLLDIRMPELDGFQTLELLRQKYEVPVIMLTGIGEVATLRDTMALGADDYIRKAFRTSELLARVKAKLVNNKARPACSLAQPGTLLDHVS